MKLLTALLTLCVPFSVAAQPIHQHPQKAAYASPVEWPTIRSDCHWLDDTATVIAGISAHAHLGLTFPYAAEMGLTPFTVPFSVTIFNGGTLTSIVTRWVRVKTWTLDNGATLPLAGNADGSPRTYTGTVTFDPAISRRAYGWDAYDLRTTTTFPDGSTLFNMLTLPTFSVVDPTQPESGLNYVRSRCELREANGFTRWGWNNLKFDQLLPLLGPISREAPWSPQAIGFNYNGQPLDGSVAVADAVLELRLDPDLHNGNPGILLARALGGARLTYRLPGDIPDGLHTLMYQWHRPTVIGDQSLVSNLVFTVTIGPGGVAPPLAPVPPPPPVHR